MIFLSFSPQHEILTTSGELSSPRFPDYYPAKKDCVWIFSTTPGHRIKLVPFVLKCIIFTIFCNLDFRNIELLSCQIYS